MVLPDCIGGVTWQHIDDDDKDNHIDDFDYADDFDYDDDAGGDDTEPVA